jgi:hypothetical protein
MSAKFFKSYFKILFFAAMLSANAFAWGNEGHHITVRIAANYLNPAARAEVIRLLKTDAANNEPYYKANCADVLALSKKANLTTDEQNSFVSDGLACVASWADPPLKYERNYTSNWHFVDIPVILATSATPTVFSYDAARDCAMNAKSGDCAIQALERFEPILANYKNTADKDHQYGEELTVRAEALKFFIHIVGDLHQPLHCANDKKNQTDKGDIGGNIKYATWFGEDKTDYGAMNLHSIWDGGFIGRTMKNNSWTETEYARKLISAIPTDAAALKQMQSGNYLTWANESYNLALADAYAPLPKLDAECKITYHDKKTNTDKTVSGCYHLSDDYYNRNNSIVEQQLKSGGVRLAGLLNSILKTQ